LTGEREACVQREGLGPKGGRRQLWSVGKEVERLL